MNRILKSALCVISTVMALLVAWFNTGAVGPEPSRNSTSRNHSVLPSAPVAPQPLVSLNDFQIVAANDLGMHCGDLDHRVVSILPPFNVVHAQVIKKHDGPRILDNSDVSVFYSASSNSKDPAAQLVPQAPIYKTNFWDKNPRTGNSLAFDAFSSFYSPKVLATSALNPDTGLPVPDVERFYLGDKALVLDQQAMPSVKSTSPYVSNPYVANIPQKFVRFNKNYPFFINFPFGYTLVGLNWFAAEGIPIAPFDDFGRVNSYPLMRIQAKDRTGKLTGIRGQVLASVDTVVPVSAEADCWRCHTSIVDGGNGQAACIPGFDLNCPAEGSPTNRSGVHFPVTVAAEDTAKVPLKVSIEWAADWNIVRLHDAKHGTTLTGSTPVSCQRCHYSPALDLAHLGPLGPGNLAANGKEQKVHHSNSRALHMFHGNLDLFQATMPPPNDPRRTDPSNGKPVVNTFVLDILNRTCYQCHPGRKTRCLRGAMFNGGIVCQDCHGNMRQVGDDFSEKFPIMPFPRAADLTKRVPWANEPGCQSCHTGDVLTTIALSDPTVIPAKDGIRLLRAYRTNNTKAIPIKAPKSRFAENQVDGKTVLFRLSKDNHAGVFCEGCHGSTHAEWPVFPSGGTIIANDNMPSIELQKHEGKMTECNVCHMPGTLPANLGGPHGMHPVNDQNWVNNHEGFLEANPISTCKACHGKKGQGTVLSKVVADRIFIVEENTVKLPKGTLVGCSLCHSNPMP